MFNATKNTFAIVTCAVVAMFSANTYAVTNLVVGGGFVGDVSGGTPPANWLVGGNTASVIVFNDATRDTDGDEWYGRMLSTNTAADTGGYLYQVVNVVANTSYDFEFDARRNGTPNRQIRVDVFDGDVTANANFFSGITLTGDLFAQTTANLGTTYAQFGQLGLLPTSSQVTIRFFDLSQSTVSSDIWLDDVQLNGQAVVPEPATASLSLLALGGLMMRRRRALA